MTTYRPHITKSNNIPSGRNVLGVMQAYFFPYIGYFQLISEVDVFVLYDKVSYRKASWLKRNRIKEKGTSQPLNITIPIQNPSSNELIEKVRIVENQDWKLKIKNLVFFNYKKAPFFEEVFDFLADQIFHEELSLHKYNSHIIRNTCEKLGIQTSIVSENEQHDLIEDNLRRIGSAEELLKQHRVIELCKLYDSTDYMNPISGAKLYDFEFFKKFDKRLNFIETNSIEYPQFYQPFLENLSIIDVLMHKGFEGTRQFLSNRKLIQHAPR